MNFTGDVREHSHRHPGQARSSRAACPSTLLYNLRTFVVKHVNDKHTVERTKCKYKVYTKRTLYVKRNTEASSYNRCFHAKAISITHSQGASVASGIQHAMRIRHIAICGLPDSTEYFHVISKRHDFRKKKNV